MGREVSQVYLLCEQCSNLVVLERSRMNSFGPNEEVICQRCDYKISGLSAKSLGVTLALSFTALIFYFPANFLPFMTMELYGRRSSSTIWEGVVQLAESGSVFIAIVVFLASIFIPFLKLAILFYLSWEASFRSQKNESKSKFQTRLYRFIELIGRWSMLDIFLLAVLVAIMKLGPWTTVEPNIGSVMFALVVVFTMLASMSFDPRLIWRNENEIQKNS